MLKRATVATSSAFNRLSAHIMYLHKPILKENFGFYENKIICSYCTRTVYIYDQLKKFYPLTNRPSKNKTSDN